MMDQVDFLAMEGSDHPGAVLKTVLTGLDVPIDMAKSAFESNGLLSSGLNLHKSKVGAFKHYPRMARRLLTTGWSRKNQDILGPLNVETELGVHSPPEDEGALADSMNRVALLVDSLNDIFGTISPVSANLQCFGDAVGNALLLTCIDFENECKGVLRANGFALPDRPNTSQYVKVDGPLRLKDYTVSFPSYPMIEARSPFADWVPTPSTVSIPWYDAYNAYKHDRYLSAERATVNHLIDAAAAIAIMMAAQYRAIPSWRQRIGSFFAFPRQPSWAVEESYVVPFNRGHWRPQNYSF